MVPPGIVFLFGDMTFGPVPVDMDAGDIVVTVGGIIPSKDYKMLEAAEVAAWEAARNAAKSRVRWHFTTANARIKLQRLYPVIEPVSPAEAKH